MERLTNTGDPHVDANRDFYEIYERLAYHEDIYYRERIRFNNQFGHSVNVWEGSNPYEVWQDFIGGRLIYNDGFRLRNKPKDVIEFTPIKLEPKNIQNKILTKASYGSWYEADCPYCVHRMVGVNTKKLYNYCPHCGQKLLWNVTEGNNGK